MNYIDFLLSDTRWGRDTPGHKTDKIVQFLQANVGALEQEITWLQKVKKVCPDLSVSMGYGEMYYSDSVCRIATDCYFSWVYDEGKMSYTDDAFRYEYMYAYILIDGRKIYSNRWGYRLGQRDNYGVRPDEHWESLLIEQNIPVHLIQKTREYLAANVGPDPDEDWEAVLFPVREDD